MHRRQSYFIWKQAETWRLDQGPESTPPAMGAAGLCAPDSSHVAPARAAQCGPNTKTMSETKSEDSLQDNSPKICECVKVIKIKKRLRKYSRLKEAKEHNNRVRVG